MRRVPCSLCLLLFLGFVASADDQRKPDAVIYVQVEEGAALEDDPCNKFRGQSPRLGGEVCARDGHTYPNHAFLKCVNRRKPPDKRVQLKHKGACVEDEPPPECDGVPLEYEPVCGTDNRTYASPEALRCRNAIDRDDVRVARHGECQEASCPCRQGLDKVCASNGRTYRNVGEVRCLKKWHPQLRLLHYGGCTVREVRRAMSRRIACHVAKNRFEWNPVCGQNNLTYANPYVYICHRPKNEGKCAAKPGECGTLRQLACLHMEKINQNIMESTSLVCGSNGITYRSYEHLHCSTNYDKYLTAISTGKCTKKYDPCALVKRPLMDGGQPVCGTNNVTYTSIEALWCARRKGKKDLKYKYDGQCL